MRRFRCSSREGSSPSTSAAMRSCMSASTEAAPNHVSPSPTSPSSVCTRTQSKLGCSLIRRVSRAVILISSSPIGATTLRRPPVADDVEEDRRGEAHGVEAVEHSAVALDQRAPVLDAAVALDRRHHQAAEEPEDRDQERDQGGLRRGERLYPPQARAGYYRAGDAADQSLDGLRR